MHPMKPLNYYCNQMNRYITTLFAALIIPIVAMAQEVPDSSALVARYNRLFSQQDSDSIQAFYEVSKLRQEIAQQKGDMDTYYDMQINEISYEASRGKFAEAIKKANDIIDDIQHDSKVGSEYYGHVYKSLGSIFEHRGNYQMANRYYENALNHLVADPNGPLPTKRHQLIGNLYAGLSRVNLFYAVDKSWEWNELLGKQFGNDPHFLKPYLAHKARIYFYRHQPDSFLIVKRQFDHLVNSPQAPQYFYGERKLRLMENVIKGNTELALLQLDSLIANDPLNLNAAMRIHAAIGRKDLALEDAYRWVHLQDSLSSELINNNLNELNIMIGTDKVQREAAQERERWMLAVIIILTAAILLLVHLYMSRRRLFNHIAKQNHELEIALDEAKESDRMKTAFVQHISHEMRTPLNIITGNAQIIASPEYELDQEEQDILLRGINENTVAITNIVNDLLEMSLSGSKGHYRRDDLININNLGHNVIDAKEGKNEKGLKLTFETQLPDDFTIQNNYGGIERILIHLLGNALKFTEHGSVELLARLSTDGNNVEFIVTDTGIGIDEEHRKQVFEPFYKVDQFKQGMGIGLPLARKVAIGLGGKLEIDSTYTNGTRMVLTIPTGK